MTKKRLFLVWAAIVTMILVGLGGVAALGWFRLMMELDMTRISVVIIAIFAAGTVWCGVQTWRADILLRIRSLKVRSVVAKDIANDAEYGWFAAGMCEKLGLTGTVLGFVIMLSGLTEGALSADPEAVQQLLVQMSGGMSTAFVTTLVGVVFGILLHLQFFVLERWMAARLVAVPDEKREEGGGDEDA